MSARAKKLVVIGVFILSMALVLVLLIVTKPKDEPEADVTETDSSITVMPYLRDDVAQMTVHNESGEYTIRNGVSGFVIDEFNGFRQNSTTMGAAARCAAELKAEALVEENAENLDKYGLSDDNPKSRCDVTLKDGTAYTLYFGIDAPDGEIYVLLGGRFHQPCGHRRAHQQQYRADPRPHGHNPKGPRL